MSRESPSGPWPLPPVSFITSKSSPPRRSNAWTGYADGYDLYAIDIAYDYDLDRIIAAGVRDDQAYIDAVVAQVLPGVPVHVQAPQFACSAFVAVDAEGRVRTGRNYDFKDDTSALLVRNHPRRRLCLHRVCRP